MGDGAENRSRLKKHVRAAREWLGNAEDSLDRREDVRGDLDLMLARAELARAQETERPCGSVLWARRVLPLAAALLLAEDASERTRETLSATARAKNIAAHVLLTKEELGHCLGKSERAAAVLLDKGFAKLLEERLQGMG